MRVDEEPLDWSALLKGKRLLPERMQALTEALRVRCNAAHIPGSRLPPGCAGGNVDRRRLARSINAAGLAVLLRGLDPVNPSTEDKVQAVVNVLPLLVEDLAPALCTGGVHSALLALYLSCSWDWELHELTLQALRLLLEGCAATTFGLDPFETDSLVELTEALTDHLQHVLEAGMEAKFVAGVDHCLEGLFCIVRYRGHPGAEAAKARCWELGLPDTLLELARVPEAAYGEEEEEGEIIYVTCIMNCQRILHSLCQSNGDIPEALLKFGELMRLGEHVWESLRCILQLGVDLLCGRRMQDRPAIVTMGAAIVRNIFSIVGFGAYWVPAKDLLPWKDAGWGPLLLDITGACDPGGWYQDGPYCAYFVGMGFTLLGALPRYRGKSKEEGRRFAANLLDLTLQLSVPDDSPAALSHSRPRDLSGLLVNELRQAVDQVPGPDGPTTMYKSTITTRTYNKRCGQCGKTESELAAAASGSTGASGSSSGEGAAAAEAPKLRACSNCRRIHYCCRRCQKMHWPDHKDGHNENLAVDKGNMRSCSELHV